MYKGKIYKTTNMLGLTLAQYCPDDSAMAREQKKIEQELADFEKNIFGDPAKKDSLDSIAAAQQVDKKSKKERKSKRERSSAREKRQRSSGSSATAPAAISVRRERH